TTKFEALAEADLTSTRKGGMGYQAKGMVNVPIIQDKLAGRAMAFYEDGDGYIDNRRLGINDINDVDTWGGRFSLQLDVNDDFNLLATAYLQRTETGAINAFSKPDGDLVAIDFVRTGLED